MYSVIHKKCVYKSKDILKINIFTKKKENILCAAVL